MEVKEDAHEFGGLEAADSGEEAEERSFSRWDRTFGGEEGKEEDTAAR
jgi:hypothetical protein